MADSAASVRRSTKRLRAPAESQSLAASSHGLDLRVERRRKRGSAATSERQSDSERDEDEDEDAGNDSDDGALPVRRSLEEESETKEEKEADDDSVPPALFPATAAASLSAASSLDASYIRIPVPAHRYTPLKAQWQALYQPVVEHMKLQIRFNPKKRCIELRTSELSVFGASSLHKSADFLRAFLLGFDVSDAIALLRLDELYVESFQVRDVKSLHGEHLSRAIGRIAGASGKTKFTIENATKTRIVLADTHVHILGSYSAIQTAKSAIVKLIMGAPPGKIFRQMAAVAHRVKERF